MITKELQPLFWDINTETFDPIAYPDYTIFRVLEHGDERALAWLRETFADDEIRRVITTERRLSAKAATFWALVYRIPSHKVTALTLLPRISSIQFGPTSDLTDRHFRPRLIEQPSTTSMSHSSTKVNNPRIFEEAREAIIKLETLSRVLTPAELETLEILFDKHATAIIATSLQEAQLGKIESITKLL